jgi:hypothetical protein
MAKTVDVAPNEKIASTWGNEIRDRTCQVFSSVAERDAQWTAPPNGALCVTVDTNTLWRRIAGAWQNLQPFIYATETTVSTDAFGSFAVALPAGAKALTGHAQGAMSGFPMIMVRNADDQPAGASQLIFRAFNTAGAPFASTVITVSIIAVWTY